MAIIKFAPCQKSSGDTVHKTLPFFKSCVARSAKKTPLRTAKMDHPQLQNSLESKDLSACNNKNKMKNKSRTKI